MTNREWDTLVAKVFEAAKHTDLAFLLDETAPTPQEWNTSDVLTFGAWRAGIEAWLKQSSVQAAADAFSQQVARAVREKARRRG